MRNLSDLDVESYALKPATFIPFSQGTSLVRARQRDGSSKWKVVESGFTLNKSGEWEYEPLPSSRDDEYLARTRFDSPEEALKFYDRIITEESEALS